MSSLSVDIQNFNKKKLTNVTTTVKEFRETSPTLINNILPETPFIWDLPIDSKSLLNGEQKQTVSCCGEPVELLRYCNKCGIKVMPQFKQQVRVAVLKAPGMSEASIRGMTSTFEDDLVITTQIITCQDVINGILHNFSVLCVPGGAHRPALAQLQDEGRREVIRFISEGGGYIGVCGGAFFAHHLGIAGIDCKGTIFENEKFFGVHGVCKMKPVSDMYDEVLGGDKKEEGGECEFGEMTFNNGPLMGPPRIHRGLPQAIPLMVFNNDLCEEEISRMNSMISGAPRSDGKWSCFACTYDNQTDSNHCLICNTPRQSWSDSPSALATLKDRPPSGVMVGSWSVVVTTYGKGCLFLISPHPELTKGKQHMLRRAIMWVTTK